MRKQTIILLLLIIGINNTYAQKKSYSIGILSDEYFPEMHQALFQQLEKEVKAVVGEDATIVFDKKYQLENKYNLNKAKENYQTLVKHCDIIISLGLFDNFITQQQKNYPKPVLAIGVLDLDKSVSLSQNKTSGINNLTYIKFEGSLIDDLETFKALSDFNTIGVVISRPLFEFDNKFQTKLQEQAKILGIEIKPIPYTSLAEIENNLNGIEALLLVNSYLLKPEEVQQLAHTLIQKKIPSFSSSSKKDVEDGILATNITDDNLTQFFRRIALSIESYVNGTNFSELPVALNVESAPTININTAQAIGVPIKYSMLRYTRFVGNINKNPLAKKIYNLPRIIDEVLNQNLSLKSAEKDLLINKQNVKEAYSGYFPKVIANATGTYIDPRIAKISNGQNPEFGVSGNVKVEQVLLSKDANANIKIQKTLNKLQQEKLNQQQLDAVLNASSAYFRSLILKSNVTIQMRNVALTEKNIQIATQNYKGGQTGKTDLLRLQSQKAQNSQNLIEASTKLQQGLIAINQLANNPIDYTIDVEDVSLDSELFKEYNYDGFADLFDSPTQRETFIKFLIDEAIKNAPELKQLQHNLEVVKRQKKLYGIERIIPTIALQGQYSHNFLRAGEGSSFPTGFPTPPDGNYNIALNVNIPLFNQNINNIKKRTAHIQQEQLNINKENVELAIATNIRNGVLNLIAQISNIELSKVSETSAKEALEITQTAYTSGAVNIVQLIDAQNNYLNTQLAKSNATYNYLLTMLQLERYIGNYFLLNTPEERTAFTQRYLDYKNK